VPTPAARRRTAAVLFHDAPLQGVDYPGALLRDAETYWPGWSAREGALAPTGLAATAVACYLLGRCDGGAEPEFVPVPRPDERSDTLTVQTFVGGFLCCLVLVLLGLALVSLRSL
jgi:hypothetical protein